MTDTPAPPPTWWQSLLLGLVPSLNTSITAVATFLLTLAGTLYVAIPAPKAPIPAADKPAIVSALTADAFATGVAALDARLALIEGAAGLCVTEIQALRAERTDKLPPAAQVQSARAVRAQPKPQGGLIEALAGFFGVGK